MKQVPHKAFQKEQGAALVIVLALVVFATMIVVSLATAMRLERMSASAYRERAQSSFFAQEGIDNVASAIREATASPRHWASMPGQIISSSNNLALEDQSEIFPLYSATKDESGSTANLNRLVRSGDNKTLIDGRNNESDSPMEVGWIYVRKDGTREISASVDTSNHANPIVGRFAYWADDESTRINLNTAWKEHFNTNSTNHPSRISITAMTNLTETDADELHAAAKTFPFLTAEDARRVQPKLADTRFATTHRSLSPAVNPWGDPKIFLTTRLDRLPPEIQTLDPDERWKYYFDVTTADNADPGNFANLSATKVERTLKHVHDMLARTNWPYGSGSFVDKYGDLNAAQISMDLMEYVRSVESTRKFVTPLRVHFNEAGTYSVSSSEIASTNPRILVGTTRRPYITELGIWDDGMGVASNGDNASRHYYILRSEFVVPKNTGLTGADLNNMIFEFSIRFQPGTGTDYYTLGSSDYGNEGTTSSSNMQVSDNGRYLIFVITTRTSTTYKDLPSSGKVYMRLLLRGYIADDPRNPDFQPSVRDVSPAAATLTQSADAANYWVVCPVNAKGSTGNTAQVSDPRLNKYRDNFSAKASTLGNLNTDWLKNQDPTQDRDSGGNVTDEAFVLPQSPTTSEAPRVTSIAEIGYVCTGGGAQMPWRSIRLQPAGTSTNLPDWALADLFLAPYYPMDDGQISPTNSIMGRINLNVENTPFGNSVIRTEGLRAVLKDRADASKLDELVENLRQRTPASGSAQKALYSIGQLAEIKGFADTGETSEQSLKGILDLVSVQGNIFRVHSIGQSITQTPQGKLVVQAEAYEIALLERDIEGNVKTILKKSIPY